MKPQTYDYLSEGHQLLNSEQYHQAIGMYEQFLELVPRSDTMSQAQALYGQSTCYKRMGDIEKAEDLTNKARALEGGPVDKTASQRLEQMVKEQDRA